MSPYANKRERKRELDSSISKELFEPPHTIEKSAPAMCNGLLAQALPIEAVVFQVHSNGCTATKARNGAAQLRAAAVDPSCCRCRLLFAVEQSGAKAASRPLCFE